MTKQNKVCNTCGGSGEIGYFQGESRFLLTREECPACCGFGYVMEEEQSVLRPEGTNTGRTADQGEKQ